MNESSSYKHLTVILAALLTTTVIAIVALVILLSSGSSDLADEPSATTSGTLDRGSIGTSGTVNQPNTSTPTTGGDTATGPATTTGGNGTTTAPSATEPPVTTNPNGENPPDAPIGPVNGSAFGDKLGSLQIYGEWKTIAYDEATGSCTLSLSLYCDSYSIGIGPRHKNYLVINDHRIEFATERVDVATNDHQTRTLLYSTEYEIQKDSPTERFPVHIEFGWHYQGLYSGEFAEWLTLTADFVV